MRYLTPVNITWERELSRWDLQRAPAQVQRVRNPRVAVPGAQRETCAAGEALLAGR